MYPDRMSDDNLHRQAWDAQSPHAHSRTAGNYPGFGLEGGHNHCRNPDGEPWAWCYTTNPDKRWEFCSRADVPACGRMDVSDPVHMFNHVGKKEGKTGLA